jgi:hypothetical protein
VVQDEQPIASASAACTRAFDALKPVVKAKWTKLLDHNRHDVFGMMELVNKTLEVFVPT